MKLKSSTTTVKTWDARLANLLVRPLKDSWVTPNHLTTVRLITGLAAAAAIAVGGFVWCNIGAGLFFLAAFLDHTDGELARLSGKTSKWGHRYDLISDAIALICLFLSIGYTLSSSELGNWAFPLSVITGLSIASIFYFREQIESRYGKQEVRLPHFAGFDAEDILYLFPIVTLLQGLIPFAIATAICTPIVALLVIRQYRSYSKP